MTKTNIEALYHPLNSRAGEMPIKTGLHLIQFLFADA
jgi:hypothetical protein